ncbi:bifunctional 4-hydroxy-2-oxoglutarate aldolase/2-dehydro-3-deoxy-phosphogluconate aldolase [Microlunatus sp. Y2014]|uniref:bifunctional 4-hydroxy-2-oxoglutarate aldolase/2-dehydro-3-deoxy-phosphogluconate aldolase n=1 Tax=Microlunatus sp. Y2014 TaxID=3418488 RepID=UPI003DA778E7
MTGAPQDAAELIKGRSVMAIFRGFDTDRTVELARRAWDLGIDLVEVPIQDDASVATLQALLVEAKATGRTVGAGTVITPEQVADCAGWGVGFIVSPGLDADVVRACGTAGLPHLPGVATPSEVQQAYRLGCTVQKAFPASVLGTGWFAAMRGPFPQVRFVATGGLDADNAADFLAAGASMVALGSALTQPDQLDRVAAIVQQCG